MTRNGSEMKGCVNAEGQYQSVPQCSDGAYYNLGREQCVKLEFLPVGSSPSGTSTATNAGSPTMSPAAVADGTVQTVTADLYGIFVAIFGVVLTLFVLFTTGSIMAVLVLWSAVGLILTVLFY